MKNKTKQLFNHILISWDCVRFNWICEKKKIANAPFLNLPHFLHFKFIPKLAKTGKTFSSKNFTMQNNEDIPSSPLSKEPFYFFYRTF